MAVPFTLTPVTLNGSERIKLTSPYHPALPAKAKALGGRFSGDTRAWYFDPRDADRVRALAVQVYGFDPLAPTLTETVTLRVRISGTYAENAIPASGDTLWLAGREIARRPGRDEDVRVGEGVAVVDGSFPSRGGSRANPSVLATHSPVMTLEIRDVPLSKAKEIVERYETAAEILADAPAPAVSPIEDQIVALARQLSPERRQAVAASLTAL